MEWEPGNLYFYGMDSIVVLSSDDEDFIDLISDDDSEDVHFERNIELAKQLSLQVSQFLAQTIKIDTCQALA